MEGMAEREQVQVLQQHQCQILTQVLFENQLVDILQLKWNTKIGLLINTFRNQTFFILGGFIHYHPDSVVAVSNVNGTKPKSHLIHQYHNKRNSVNIITPQGDDTLIFSQCHDGGGGAADQQRAILDKLNGNPAMFAASSSSPMNSGGSHPICPLLETQM